MLELLKTELLALSADDFHELRQMIPEFDEAVKTCHKRHEENISFLEEDSLKKNWTNQAMKAISLGTGQQLQLEPIFKRTMILIVMRPWLFGWV